MNKYVPDEYYSVIYKATGKKKCDCGWESDAMSLVSMDPEKLTYIKNTNHLMGQVVDIEIQKQLPTNEVVHIPTDTTEYSNHQNKWMVDKIKKLNQSDLKEFTGE